MSAAFARQALEHFAGLENVYVAVENDQLTAMALAVPVSLKGRPGSYLYGLCGEGSLIRAGLLDYLCAQQKLRGAGFTVAVPQTPAEAELLREKGFERAFALRCLPRSVSRNLWAQAEFDTVTAKSSVNCGQDFGRTPFSCRRSGWRWCWGSAMPGCDTGIQRSGIRRYFRSEDTLYFVEMMAEDDRAAEKLMEAAREKGGHCRKAVITVGAAQTLFWEKAPVRTTG